MLTKKRIPADEVVVRALVDRGLAGDFQTDLALQLLPQLLDLPRHEPLQVQLLLLLNLALSQVQLLAHVLHLCLDFLELCCQVSDIGS